MKRRAPEIAALAIYAVLVVFVTLHHESWRDEADSWLLARDASLPEIFERMPYAGTPALWYMVLLPFAKSGLPFLAQSLINNALVIAAAAVLLFCSPLPRAVNIALIFTYYPLFEYGVIARSYGLSVLLLVAALALWDRARPVSLAITLGLLANTNTHSLLLAAALAVLWIGTHVWATRPLPLQSGDGTTPPPSRASRLVPFAIIVALFSGAALLQIRPPADGNLAHAGRPMIPAYAGEAVSEAFFPLMDVTAGKWLALASLGLLTALLFRRRAELLFFWATTTALLALFVFVWVGGRRHYGFIALAAFAALWIAKPERWPRWIAALLAGSLVWSAGAGLYTSWRDITEPFSGAKEVARFIESRGLAGLPIAGHPAPQAAAILPYFEAKQIWFAGIGEWGSYQKWDRRFEEGQRVSYPEAVLRAKQRFGGREFLLLLNVEMPDPDAEGYRLLFQTPEVPFGRADERYWLYDRLRRSGAS